MSSKPTWPVKCLGNDDIITHVANILHVHPKSIFWHVMFKRWSEIDIGWLGLSLLLRPLTSRFWWDKRTHQFYQQLLFRQLIIQAAIIVGKAGCPSHVANAIEKSVLDATVAEPVAVQLICMTSAFTQYLIKA